MGALAQAILVAIVELQTWLLLDKHIKIMNQNTLIPSENELDFLGILHGILIWILEVPIQGVEFTTLPHGTTNQSCFH